MLGLYEINYAGLIPYLVSRRISQEAYKQLVLKSIAEHKNEE
jgi:hypothetical protein